MNGITSIQWHPMALLYATEDKVSPSFLSLSRRRISRWQKKKKRHFQGRSYANTYTNTHAWFLEVVCTAFWRGTWKICKIKSVWGFFGRGKEGQGTGGCWHLESGNSCEGLRVRDFYFWPWGETGEYWPHGVIAGKSEGRGETEVAAPYCCTLEP